MLRSLLRRMIREELEHTKKDMATYLADLIVRNNKQIEQDLISAGVLEPDQMMRSDRSDTSLP
jgi:hypothetical protein